MRSASREIKSVALLIAARCQLANLFSQGEGETEGRNWGGGRKKKWIVASVWDQPWVVGEAALDPSPPGVPG